MNNNKYELVRIAGMNADPASAADIGLNYMFLGSVNDRLKELHQEQRILETTVQEQTKSVFEAIDELGAPIVREFGPSVLTPSATEVASFYPAVNMLEEIRVEIYLSEGAKRSLDRSPMGEEIKRMNKIIRERIGKKTGRADIEDPIKPLSCNSTNLKTCLGRKEKTEAEEAKVRRIFVNDSELDAEFKKLVGDDINLLRGKRVITMNVEKGNSDIENTVREACRFKIELLSALLDESNKLTIGARLKDELAGRIDVSDGILEDRSIENLAKDPETFISYLLRKEDSATTDKVIRARVEYFRGAMVKISTFIGEQLRILKAFLMAA